jgi:hypothetical protein
MRATSKMVTLLTISVTLMLSGSHVLAKTVGPGQVKTSGTSAAPSGAAAAAGRRATLCHHNHYYYACSPPASVGGGVGGPNRGPGNPTLHPK